MEKECPVCKETKPIGDFAKRTYKSGKVSRNSYCKPCQRAYAKTHYKQNKNYYLKKAKRNDDKRYEEIQRYIVDYLQENTCVDCDETDIVVLEFDHVREDKNFTISDFTRKYRTLDDIKEEIKKCDIRCANCHRRVTAKRGNFWIMKYVDR